MSTINSSDKPIQEEPCDVNGKCRNKRICRRLRSTAFRSKFLINRAVLALAALILLTTHNPRCHDTVIFCNGEEAMVSETSSPENAAENDLTVCHNCDNNEISDEPLKEIEEEDEQEEEEEEEELTKKPLKDGFDKDTLRIVEENGIRVLTQVDSIFHAVNSDEADPKLLLMLVYSPQCPHSRGVLFRLEKAAKIASKFYETLDVKDNQDPLQRKSSPLGITFAKIDATKVDDQNWLHNYLELEAYPTLVFVLGQKGAKDDNAYIIALDYLGAQSTSTEIFETALHNWYRLVLPSSFSDGSASSVNAGEPEPPVFVLESNKEMLSFLELHGNHLVRHAAPAFNPDTTPNERQYIKWLLQLESGAVDDYIIFVQCRPKDPMDGVDEYYDSFNNLAQTMSNRRDVAFFAVRDCSEEGEVVAITIPSTKLANGGMSYWEELLESGPRFKPSADVQDSIQRKMTEFIVVQSTPLIMWFDRKSIAPLAFPIYRQVHAVLFVNFHRPKLREELDDAFFKSEDSLQTRAAIRDLRKAMIHHRQIHPYNDMVALIVPSTETRIMNTFGVDIWRSLDQFIQSSIKAKKKKKKKKKKEDNEEERKAEPYPTILPSLLVTDQRNHRGTQRYYLDFSDIAQIRDQKKPSAIEKFISDFWDGRLKPEIQSQENNDAIVNDSGVQSITGNTFETMVLDQTDKHTLLYIYAPTCGHCKRFSVLWNELCSLIRHLKWDNFIDVMKMDITKNEIVSKHFQLETVKFVPEVYYFPLGKKEKAIRFDILDEFGDGAGRLSDPLDVLDWLINISGGDGGLSEEELLDMLEELEFEETDELEGIPQEDTTTV